MILFMVLATIISKVLDSIYKPCKTSNNIDKSNTLDFKKTLNNIHLTLFVEQKCTIYLFTANSKAKSLENKVLQTKTYLNNQKLGAQG